MKVKHFSNRKSGKTRRNKQNTCKTLVHLQNSCLRKMLLKNKNKIYFFYSVGKVKLSIELYIKCRH